MGKEKKSSYEPSLESLFDSLQDAAKQGDLDNLKAAVGSVSQFVQNNSDDLKNVIKNVAQGASSGMPGSQGGSAKSGSRGGMGPGFGMGGPGSGGFGGGFRGGPGKGGMGGFGGFRGGMGGFGGSGVPRGGMPSFQNSRPASADGQNAGGANNAPQTMYNQGMATVKPKRFRSVTVTRILSSALQVLAGAFSAGNAFLLIVWTIGMFTDPEILSLLGIFVEALFLVCFGVGAIGFYVCNSIRKETKRFLRYQDIIGDRDYCDVRELSDRTGVPLKTVRDDLERLCKNGDIYCGRLDKQGTCLILTDEAFKQYQATQKALEERMKEEAFTAVASVNMDGQNAAAGQSGSAASGISDGAGASDGSAADSNASTIKLSPEVRALLDRGSFFVAQIRELNDRIPGEEISAKIDQVENAVVRILDRVQVCPEAADDLGKMMDFYLPTTVKMLNAYAELDEHEVKGARVDETKAEIMTTLDTLTAAYEKIFDDTFHETMVDVSSDISVLNTVLAQEGLIGNDFTTQKGE